MTKADLVEIVYEKIGGLSKKESQTMSRQSRRR